MTYPWLRPATVSMELILAGRAYADEHSLPGYDEVEPPVEVRGRVLAEIRRLPVLSSEADDGPDIDCLCCMDTGFFVGDFSDIEVPCPDCLRGDWTWRHELNDDQRYGK